jgi:predicted Zn-dependent peptidase
MMRRRLAFPAAVLSLVAASACGPGPAEEAPPLDRSVRPAPGPTPAFDFPTVERRRLSNGLELWLVARPGVPMVAVRLLVEAGAAVDPPGQPGLAALTASMLVEGTTTRTGLEIADELAYLAADLNASAGQESTVVSLTTLTRNLEPALGLMADVVVNATFPDSEWPRVQDLRLVSLSQALDQPTTLATRHFNRQVYGFEHPLGRPVDGTPTSVEAFTPAALRAFHRARYRPGSAHLVAAGDVDTERLVAALERAFAGWTWGEAPRAEPPAAPAALPATRVYLIDKPGAAQSEVRIGHVGVTRDDPDYIPLLVLNTILGGQFSSRINLNLREDKGYTYGARSAFDAGRLAGPFVASGGVQTAVTRESIVEFLREIADIRGGRPVTDAETEFAKASIVRREPLAVETHAQIAGRVLNLILYDLPLDYYDSYTDRIAAITTADVNRAAREHLDPGRLVIVVVGDRAQIETAIRALPYPVALLQADAYAERPR